MRNSLLKILWNNLILKLQSRMGSKEVSDKIVMLSVQAKIKDSEFARTQVSVFLHRRIIVFMSREKKYYLRDDRASTIVYPVFAYSFNSLLPHTRKRSTGDCYHFHASIEQLKKKKR